MVQQSLIDQIVPAGVIPLSHVVDNFNGDALNERWTENATGGGSGAMLDEENGGYRLTTSSSGSGNSRRIHFNGINHYSQTGAVIIGVVRRNDAVSRLITGFAGSGAGTANTVGLYNDAAATFMSLKNVKSFSASTVNTSIGIHTNWTEYKVGVRSTSTVMSLDGVLEATNTGQLPDFDFEPQFYGNNSEAAEKRFDIRYMEAYNT